LNYTYKRASNVAVGALTKLTFWKRKICLYTLAKLINSGYTLLAIDEQSWGTNRLDLYGYSLRNKKCLKNVKSCVPSLSLLLACTSSEIIGLAFVARSTLAIYFADFIEGVMKALREKQRNS
jgi:hypothetical protein